jgi:hypothetical protein
MAAVFAGWARADVAGQQEPAFVEAFDLWLTGDEAASLPTLSELAVAGNGAARMLLGVIDSNPAMQGGWLDRLPRAGRLAILRQPGGLSGRNWLVRLAKTDPVAKEWVQVWDAYAKPDVVLRLARLGEPRAARVAGNILASRDMRGFGDLAAQPDFPAGLLVFAILDLQRRDPARALSLMARLEVGNPQRALLLAEKDSPTDSARWLASHPEGDPLIALCEAICPTEPMEVCGSSALGGLGGYHGLMDLGSPVEALIASSDFNRSPKGIEVTRRRIAPMPHTSACLADALKR